MKRTIIALSAACLMASTTAVLAQGVSNKTPGHEMQDKGSQEGQPGCLRLCARTGDASARVESR